MSEVSNLPSRLLDERLRLFRVEAEDPDTGQRRVFMIDAKHVGAAQTKAWRWGLKVRRVEPVIPDEPIAIAELAE